MVDHFIIFSLFHYRNLFIHLLIKNKDGEYLPQLKEDFHSDKNIFSVSFLEKIVSKMKARSDVRVSEYGRVSHKDKSSQSLTLPLIKIESKKKYSKEMVITAGFHGDEIAGPLTLLRYCDVLFDMAHRSNIKLSMYPLVNPSGFDLRKRYNHKNEIGNNDFMRYFINGEQVDNLGSCIHYFPWNWNQDISVVVPEETMHLRKNIRLISFEKVSAFLDLHQDCFQEGLFSYAYVFGEKKEYISIMNQIREYAHLLVNKPIEEGQNTPENISKLPSSIAKEISSSPLSDDYGMVVRHDGSIQDLFCRMGVPYSATVETTTDLPLEYAYAVNMIWITGLLHKIAENK